MNRGQVNPYALGLVVVGAAAMAIAVFLPFNEPNGVFSRVEHNTLIQHGGWPFIALAIGIAVGGFPASQRRGRWLAWPIALCLIGAWHVFDWATDKDSRTLYPVGIDGTVDTSKPGTVAPLGVALYVAGVGVAVALIGSLMLLRTHPNRDLDDDPLVAAWAERPTKNCPDCAETILADAKVCKHCGYRFAPSSHDAPPKAVPAAKPATAKSSKVKCHKCEHVQTVPLDLSLFVCQECGTKLKRRTATSYDDDVATEKRSGKGWVFRGLKGEWD